jgi:hypothetical protein
MVVPVVPATVVEIADLREPTDIARLARYRIDILINDAGDIPGVKRPDAASRN